MSNPYQQNQFGGNYYSFEDNVNHSYSERNRNRPQIRPKLPQKRDYNFAHNNNNYGHNARHGRPPGPPVTNEFNQTNNYYRRPTHPFGTQYRAQVIDYSNGSQTHPQNQSMARMPVNPYADNNQQIGDSQSSLLQTPNPYPNARAYGQPSNVNRSLLPTPGHSNQQQFVGRPPTPQQYNAYQPLNQSIPQPIPKPVSHPYSQNVPQMVPKPVPPPPPPSQPPPPVPPPTVRQLSNLNQSMVSKENKIDVQSQQKLEESRVEKLIAEGMEKRYQNDLKGFYCLFCDSFANNLMAAERHVETPKHHRIKIGDYLKGIDAKFTVKSERIRETAVALARKEELNKISNVIKNEYFNEGIRLKDGIGSEAYICENCGLSVESLAAVNKHLELHKQFEQQLKVCSKPVIGLDFITEYIDPDPNKARIYECVMCRSFYSTRDVLSHVCSFTHRTNFIKKIHPSEGLKYTSETQQLSLEAGKRALELETLVGRGQFKAKNQSAPQNALISISFNYGEPPNSESIGEDIKPSKPVVQIELPKAKSEHEKTDLEKLFSIELKSDSEANDVTKIITSITSSVTQYHMRGMTPEMKQQFKQKLKDNKDISALL